MSVLTWMLGYFAIIAILLFLNMLLLAWICIIAILLLIHTLFLAWMLICYYCYFAIVAIIAILYSYTASNAFAGCG